MDLECQLTPLWAQRQLSIEKYTYVVKKERNSYSSPPAIGTIKMQQKITVTLHERFVKVHNGNTIITSNQANTDADK